MNPCQNSAMGWVRANKLRLNLTRWKLVGGCFPNRGIIMSVCSERGLGCFGRNAVCSELIVITGARVISTVRKAFTRHNVPCMGSVSCCPLSAGSSITVTCSRWAALPYGQPRAEPNGSRAAEEGPCHPRDKPFFQILIRH